MSLTLMSHLLMMAVVLACLVHHGSAGDCSYPDPAKGFTHEGYEGRWFEIGKIQTKGGAFFEKDCVCTELTASIMDQPNGDGSVDNDCRSKTPDGKWTNVTGTLTGEDPAHPGRWLEHIGPSFAAPVNYTVIALDENTAVEYDCGTSMGITNYCIHVMSRTRTMEQSTFDSLIKFAEDLGLNPNNLPVSMTKQDGC